MWIGAGLWHDTDFYTAFEASHRAVFVWSMYLAFGPDGYIRYGLDDPMAALASRTASFNEYLHNPPWAAEWIVDQAREHRIDGALVLRPRSMKPAAHRPPLHRARARGRGYPGAADRGGRRRRARLGSGRRARRRPLVSRDAGAAVTTTVLPAAPAELAAALRGDAHRDVRAAAVEPRVLAAAAVDPAGIRHELHAARTLHRAVRPAGDAAQRAGRTSAPGASARSVCSASACLAWRQAACCSERPGASGRRSRFAA